MPHQLVPVSIKPHLIPFLFKEFEAVLDSSSGIQINVAKHTIQSPMGKILRSLMQISHKKVPCDTIPQIFLKVQEKYKYTGIFHFADGRTGFLYLPEEAQGFLNEHLQKLFDISLMNSIHSWSKSNTDQGINDAIVSFLETYNLEEYNYTLLGIRRDYYRKRKARYFESSVFYNTMSNKIEH